MNITKRRVGIIASAAVVAAGAAAYLPTWVLGVADAATNPAPAASTDDNTISATAQATVTVVDGGLSLQKASNRSTIVTGQNVTFTYLGTATGSVSFSEVQVEDDKCSPVTFVSGDTNGDSLLNPGETWKWTCSQKLTKTTTNIGTIQGKPVFSTPTASPSGTPSPTPTSVGTVLKDGTYVGPASPVTVPEVPGEVYTDTVTITVTSGKISNVTATLGTIPNRTSQLIAGDANTQLIAQAIANNGKISNVSGATYTYNGFNTSLQGALALAAQ
jgi:hypothetical protein